jgi:signal transduction histidine kinase
MGFRRRAGRALAQALLFGCGVGVVLAWRAGFYACATVLALTGFWIGAATAWPDRSWAGAALVEEPAEADGADREQRLLATLLDQTPAPLLIVHPDGLMRAGNRAARLLFQTDDRLTPPPPGLLEALRGDPSGGRMTVTLETGAGPRPYAASVTDLVGPDGALRLAALLDIQPEIRAAEAAALRDLLQVLGHEIMNALTPIASLAATAQDLLSDASPDSTAAASAAVATLSRRAEGLNRFVEAYRTLSRLPPPTLKPVRLGDLLDETARVFDSRWRARGVALDVHPLDPDATAPLDLDLMVHALMNLLSNGAEAALANANPPPRVTLIAAKAETGGVELTVRDSGPGVPTADRERIFQPFFTTRAEGTGVGLSFARQVALSHGGDLILAPGEPGRGAVFRLTL